MSADLAPVIAAGTRWLLTAFPPAPGAFNRALAEAQVRQAVALAADLRYPTDLDVQLVHLLGPGGSERLDWLTGAGHDGDHAGHGRGDGADDGADPDGAWRTWVDETVVSWAACLLADPALARRAVEALSAAGHAWVGDALRLHGPGDVEHAAAPLLRHPDLVEPVADVHRAQLLVRLADMADGGTG